MVDSQDKCEVFLIKFIYKVVLYIQLEWQNDKVKYNSKRVMSDNMRLYLIIQTSLRIAVDASFLIMYCFRVHKLDTMASNNFHQKPKLMQFKIILLLLLELIFIAHIILSFQVENYWVYQYKDFSLVSIADFINCFLQIYIIRKEHKKKSIKSLKVPLLWILWLCFDLSTYYVNLQIITPSMTILLIIFQAMIFVALIVIGCVLEGAGDMRQGQREHIQSKFICYNSTDTTPRSPFLSNKVSHYFSQTLSSTHDSSKLYVQFNKQFNVLMRNNQAYYQFKFAVIIGQQSHILTRSEEDFINLVTQMIRMFPQCEELLIKQKKNSALGNIKRYGEQKQKLYQAYLIRLTQNDKYYTAFLLDFLQVNSYHRTKLLTKIKDTTTRSHQKKDSFANHNHDDDQKTKRPFFTVEIVNNKIHVCNEEILEIVIQKSKGEIQRFHNKLIAERKLKMQLLAQDPDINQLVHFIFRVVNSKILWKPFSQWMVLGKQLQQKIFNMYDFWNYGFRTITISIIGYEIAFDKQGSIHNLYLISLSQRKQSSPSINSNVDDIAMVVLKQDVTLKKRFNDFVKLDKHIKKFISVNNIKMNSIISLPPKFSPFGMKTSPKSRQIYLDMYLNQVIKIQGINHCVKFLEFLQVDLGRFREQFQKVDQQNLVELDISSMVIDDIESGI